MAEEHAVIVRFAYGNPDLEPLSDLEQQLENAIATAEAGEYDGNDIAVDHSDAILYMYGPNGDSLLAAVEPILERTDFVRGAEVTVRYGPPEDGVRERKIVIGR